jgi:hypothetical protein
VDQTLTGAPAASFAAQAGNARETATAAAAPDAFFRKPLRVTRPMEIPFEFI